MMKKQKKQATNLVKKKTHELLENLKEHCDQNKLPFFLLVNNNDKSTKFGIGGHKDLIIQSIIDAMGTSRYLRFIINQATVAIIESHPSMKSSPNEITNNNPSDPDKNDLNRPASGL